MDEKFIQKVIAVQSGLKAPKSQYNKFGQYPYRSCEDILEGVKPLLKEQGLILTLTDEVLLVGERFYVKATATLTDGKDSISNSSLAREEDVKKGMDGSQITGTASSYARKYALNGLFCIDDTKDADSQKPKEEEKKPEVKKPTAEEAKNILTEALEAIKNVKSEDDLKAVVVKYKPTLGKNVEFIKAVNASQFCPQKPKKK